MTKDELKFVLEALKTCGEDEWHSDDDFGMVQIYNEDMINKATALVEGELARLEQAPAVYSSFGLMGGDAFVSGDSLKRNIT
tara:strand:+ start:791 stop:1036 length:246 start_codon:yes stop_codon:yes gene_type:complete